MSRIMVVDDDPDILKYCDALLSEQGHEVVLAPNAQEAMHVLARHQVDLLILDIVMPGVSGLDLLRSLKNMNTFSAPVLMLTRKRTVQDIKTALDAGATDYMIKPFDKDILTAKVDGILGKRAPLPSVRFASSSTNSQAELILSGIVTSVNEMGLTFYTSTAVDRNIRIKLESPIFKEIGIDCPPLRTSGCKPIQNSIDPRLKYEIFISFIGLDEPLMQKIRRWISSHTIAKNKAG